MKYELIPDGLSAILRIDEPLEADVIINLAHGSGIDGTWDVSDREVEDNQIALTNSWHYMHEGSYIGWIDFEVLYTFKRTNEIIKSWSIQKKVTLNKEDCQNILNEYKDAEDSLYLEGLDDCIFQMLECAED